MACDRLLAALESAPSPLGQRELAAQLGVRQPAVSKVLGELLATGMVARFERPVQNVRGPKPHVYVPARRSPIPPAVREALRQDTIVKTPTDKVARVLRVRADGYLDLELLQVRPRSEAFVTLWWKLVQPYQPGREAPPPVRIEEPGR